MELKELQEKTSEIFLNNLKRDNIPVSDDYLVLKITEELGEFVQSYLIYKKSCRPLKYLSESDAKIELSKELSDILGIIFVIAKNLNIDIEDILVRKWINKEWVKNIK